MKRPTIILISSALLMTSGCSTFGNMWNNAQLAERGLPSQIEHRGLQERLAARNRVMRELYSSAVRPVIADASIDWGDEEANYAVFLAGVTHIRGRCSAYLNALNSYRKYLERGRGFLANTGLTAATILPFAGVAQDTIGIVASAFDFSVNNVELTESTLVLGASATTLDRLVTQAQSEYLAQYSKQDVFTNRGTIERHLQGYLHLCTPVSLAGMVEQSLNTANVSVSNESAVINDEAAEEQRLQRGKAQDEDQNP